MSDSLFDARSRASQALEQEPSRAWVEILARDVVALADDLDDQDGGQKASTFKCRWCGSTCPTMYWRCQDCGATDYGD